MGSQTKQRFKQNFIQHFYRAVFVGPCVPRFEITAHVLLMREAKIVG